MIYYVGNFNEVDDWYYNGGEGELIIKGKNKPKYVIIYEIDTSHPDMSRTIHKVYKKTSDDNYEPIDNVSELPKRIRRELVADLL